jgi:hypothetical protein
VRTSQAEAGQPGGPAALGSELIADVAAEPDQGVMADPGRPTCR